MLARHLFIAAALLLSPATAWAAENNFWCSPSFGICGCDINERTDCGLLRKNCKDETFTTCVGTQCFCRLAVPNLAVGNPPNVIPRSVLQMLPRLKQDSPKVQPLAR
jgi:hypothetical protein